MAGLTAKELAELNGTGPTAADLAELNAPAPPAVETTKDKVARLMGRQFPPAPKTFLGGMEAKLRGAAQIASGGSADEIIGGARAGVKKVLGDDRPIVDVYREERGQYRDDDTRSQREEPDSYNQGGAAASLLPSSWAAKIASPLKRLLVGTGTGMFSGLAGSKADVTKGEYGPAIRDTALGGLTGTIASVPAAAGTAARSGKLEKEYKKQITHDLTEGATPIHARRATGDDGASETIVAWVEKNKAARKAIEDTDRQALIEVAKKDIDILSAKTAPVYPKIDALAGKIKHQDIDAVLQARIAELRMGQGQTKPLIGAFEDLRATLSDNMSLHGGEYTHKQLREWVTGLLKQKQAVKGTLFETPVAIYKEELHEVADEFLRNRLDDVAAKHPKFAPEITQLRKDNRDFSAAIRVRDVAENADKLSNWKGKTVAEKVREVVTRGVTGAATGGMPGVVAGSVGLGTVGAVIGATAGVGAEKLTKFAIDRLGRLAREVKTGNATAQMVQDALDAGVPEHVLRAMSSTGRTQGIWEALFPTEQNKEKTP